MNSRLGKFTVSVAFAALVMAAPALAQVPTTPTANGSGQQRGKVVQHQIRDQNNDGVCDTCGQAVGSGQRNGKGQKAKKGSHYGPGDGTGNQGNGPKNGTGYGRKAGNGDPNSCPNGQGGRGNRGGRGGNRGGRN
jgi:hypothetical protein